MVKIKINGTQVAEEREIKERVVQVFHCLLSKSREWKRNCNELLVKALGGKNVAMLEVPFFKKEVFCALLDLGEDKAPSPNGFSMDFWQFSQDFSKKKVMGFFKDSHE